MMSDQSQTVQRLDFGVVCNEPGDTATMHTPGAWAAYTTGLRTAHLRGSTHAPPGNLKLRP